jgi:nitrite reductase/ring-hydroxylating ferredoxin subunit
MAWKKVLNVSALPEGEREVVSIEDQKILLIHHSDGEIYAVQNKCPHMGVGLKKGEISDHALTCPLHRSVFDLETGEVKAWVTWPPGVNRVLSAVSKEKNLTVYPTKVEEGAIWIRVE